MSTFTEIWERVSKDPGDGVRVITFATENDLNFLYASGFVDAEKYTMEQWLKSFDECKQKDESYIVTNKQWMAKEAMHYTGPVREPFNPLNLPEEELTEAQFVTMLKQCIIPSSQATVEKIPVILKDFKDQEFFKDGKIMVTTKVKNELNIFLAMYPSPLRVLEFKIMQLKSGEIATTGSEFTDIMASGYVAGASKAKTTQSKLDSLLGGHAKPAAQPSGAPGDMDVAALRSKMKNRPV